MLTKEVYLLHDNARTHPANTKKRVLAYFERDIQNHPANFPDLTPLLYKLKLIVINNNDKILSLSNTIVFTHFFSYYDSEEDIECDCKRPCDARIYSTFIQSRKTLHSGQRYTQIWVYYSTKLVTVNIKNISKFAYLCTLDRIGMAA